MKKLIFTGSLSILLTLVFGTCVWANDAVFGGCGGIFSGVESPQSCMLEKNTHIELVSVQLKFEQKPKFRWMVSGTYSFINHGEPVEVVIGFPVAGAAEGDQDPIPPEEYTVKVNNKPGVTTLFNILQSATEDAAETAEEYGYHFVFLTPVAFAKNEKVTLTHSLYHDFSGDSLQHEFLTYILKTGGLWRGGKIGEIGIKVYFDKTISWCLVSNLPGAQYDPASKVLNWSAKEWLPEHDLYVEFMDHMGMIEFLNFGEVEWLDPFGNAENETEASEILAKVDDKQLMQGYISILGAYRYPFSKPEHIPQKLSEVGGQCGAYEDYFWLGNGVFADFCLDEMLPKERKILIALHNEVKKRNLEVFQLPVKSQKESDKKIKAQ